jgi:hypothetical protein
MWPKVFAQLLEVLPHVSRLIPMADMFFATKSASDKANEAALAALAAGVRADLGKITSAHEGLYRQLQDQGAQITSLANDARRTRIAIEDYAKRVDNLEKTAGDRNIWAQSAVALLVVVLGLLIAILLRLH